MSEKIDFEVLIHGHDALTCSTSVLLPAKTRNRHVAILYFHGGGLLYGERDDLPSAYVSELLEAGFTLVCADYPLSPETKLPDILMATRDLWHWFAGGCLDKFGIKSYLLFGRSAGAYLALMLADYLTREGLSPAPIGIIDLYGYYDLTDDFVWRPSEHYLTMPHISRSMVAPMMGTKPLSSAPKSTRFALYVYARQSGHWGKLLGLADKEVARRHSLDDISLSRLPPLFIAASTGDEDVPYTASKHLLRVAPPGTVMKTVYYLEHDFDRDVSCPEGMRVYRQIIDWITDLTQ